jgi:uroporphyrinogen III methyltransferase/synthase
MAQASDFAAELEKYGATVAACPTIEIAEPESYAPLDEAIDNLYGYDWLVFTSVNGVHYFLQRLHDRRHQTAELDQLKVCAIGAATADRLRDEHIHVDVVPAVSKSEGVFAAIEQYVGGPDSLRGLNFLIPRAAVARDYLPVSLQAAGARADIVPAYRTIIPQNIDRGRLAAMLAGSADCIAFTSASSVKNLAQLYDAVDLSDVLKGVVVACIGDITAATAMDHGLKVSIKPDHPSVAELTQAIAEYFAGQS